MIDITIGLLLIVGGAMVFYGSWVKGKRAKEKIKKLEKEVK